ncbi:MAG: nucleotide sugar dehydrogenase [Bacteroidota bacterium]
MAIQTNQHDFPIPLVKERIVRQPRTCNQGDLFQQLLTGKAKIAVVGLGYVGLPLALEFAKSLTVIGFDIKENRVQLMRQGADPSGELPRSAFRNRKISFTSRRQDLAEAKFFIVAVPTPVDDQKRPNLRALINATESVAKVLKKGDYVVFESTVYPGCTEEICLPILEMLSGLKLNEDFKLGYSPERINPGDKKNTLTSITKVVSGSDKEALKLIADVYDLIIEAGVHQATSIKVAEASKIVENTQRDVNIALMNELSIIFAKMGLKTHDVLEAAGTKWNFLNFYPGLVGGHCIGVDPYYLKYKAHKMGITTEVISGARSVNDRMPFLIANRIFQELKKAGVDATNARILVRGITFKEDVQDIRNSKVAEMVKYLMSGGAEVVVEDPLAIPDEVKEVYDVALTETPDGKFDAIILAVCHKDFQEADADYYRALSRSNPLIFDFRKQLTSVPNDFKYVGL